MKKNRPIPRENGEAVVECKQCGEWLTILGINYHTLKHVEEFLGKEPNYHPHPWAIKESHTCPLSDDGYAGYWKRCSYIMDKDIKLIVDPSPLYHQIRKVLDV